MEMKLKHKDNEWRLGYVFNSGNPVDDVAELKENQTSSPNIRIRHSRLKTVDCEVHETEKASCYAIERIFMGISISCYDCELSRAAVR